MDDKALDDLINAHETAPSAALGKVIALQLIDRGRLEESLAYIDALESEPDETLRSVAEGIVESDQQSVAREALDPVHPLHAKILIHLCLLADETETARNLYTALVEQHPGLQDPALNELFEMDSESTAEQQRRKLRVIERPDADVVDIDQYRDETTTFEDVIGLEKIKKQVHRKIILPFQKPSLFARFRKKIGGGVLMFGPPGCGKTLLARATAGECNASFFNVQISDVLDMFIGESERKLHAIFEKARAEAPGVLFFDEIEALAGKREHARNSGISNVISMMLAELDGFSQNNSGLLVLASTNVPWDLDPAFLRPGRFDRMFFVPPPDKVARAGILRHHMNDRPNTGDIDFNVLAAKTGGFSGADLANLVEEAAGAAIDESIEQGSDVPISWEHFKEVLPETRSTTIEWLTTARNYARYSNDGGRYNDVIEFLRKHGK